MKAPPHFLNALLEPDGRTYGLRIDRTDQFVATTLELAGDSKSRTRGLLGRTELPGNTALIIAPCNAIHTFFMRFRIDAVFVDRLGRVLKITPNLGPWRIAVCLGAFATIEFTTGSSERAGLTVGDSLSIAEVPLPPPLDS